MPDCLPELVGQIIIIASKLGSISLLLTALAVLEWTGLDWAIKSDDHADDDWISRVCLLYT